MPLLVLSPAEGGNTPAIRKFAIAKAMNNRDERTCAVPRGGSGVLLESEGDN